MRWTKRQEKIEALVYETIDEIADEMNLEVPYYPEVCWVGRKLKFEDTYLPEKYRGDFEEAQAGGSSYLPSQQMIFIGEDNIIHISEEAGHYLHFVNSKTAPPFKRKGADRICTSILFEMLGYFSSKLIYPQRNNYPYHCIQNFLPEKPEKSLIKIIGKLNEEGIEDINDFIHHQGYYLGKKLFNYYLSRQISKKKITELFKNPLKGKYASFEILIEFQYNL